MKDDYSLKILDLGLLEVYPVNSYIVGTRLYIPPEVYDNRNSYGQSQDIFALGVVLFVMLIGFYPFQIDASKDDYLYQYLYYGKVSEWLLKIGAPLFP